MGRTACTEPQCLYKGDLYLYLFTHYSQGPIKYRLMTASTGYTHPSPQHIIKEIIGQSLMISDDTVSLCIYYSKIVILTDKRNHTDVIY